MSGQEPTRRDPKFRANHDRSVALTGIIDDALVARLLPEIVKLQSVSREPITLYIDSPGGDPLYAKVLLEALRASDQDRSEPCRLITVALGEVSSAASDILMAGDYALAYPYSKILCHGTRHIIDQPTALTKDRAADIARQMAGLDEGFAIILARNCIDRFMFRITRIWDELETRFAEDTNLQSDSGLKIVVDPASSFERFLRKSGEVNEALLGHLITAGQNTLKMIVFSRQSGLLDLIVKGEYPVDFKESIRAAILTDALKNSPLQMSLGELEERYQLVCDFFEVHHSKMVTNLLVRWGTDLFDRINIDESKTVTFVSEEERTEWALDWLRASCLQLWFLFVFFCRQLQTGDFPMTATEAYWLGLIDEVIGLDLPSPRILVENAPDLPNEAQGATP